MSSVIVVVADVLIHQAFQMPGAPPFSHTSRNGWETRHSRNEALKNGGGPVSS
jgi:hypothetical protein